MDANAHKTDPAVRASEEVRASIRRAKRILIWKRYDGLVYGFLLLVISAAMGAYIQSIADRSERAELMEQHSLQIAELRRYYGEALVERNRAVTDSADVAQQAATAAADATRAAAKILGVPPASAPAVAHPADRKDRK